MLAPLLTSFMHACVIHQLTMNNIVFDEVDSTHTCMHARTHKAHATTNQLVLMVPQGSEL